MGAVILLGVVRLGHVFHLTATEALLATMGLALLVLGVIYAVPSWRRRLRPSPEMQPEMRHADLDTDQGSIGFDYSSAAGSVKVVRLNGDGTTSETYAEWGEIG